MAINEQLKQFMAEDGNIIDLLEDDQVNALGDYIDRGIKVDEESRSIWLKRNLEAMDLIKHIEDPDLDNSTKSGSIKSCKVIYPLLASAAIHAASRLIPHFTRNDKTCEVTIHGVDDTGVKQKRAEDTAEYVNYQLLVESDTWLKESHKLAHMIMTWGMGFRRTFWDEDEDTLDFQLVSPTDIILNHNISTLRKAPRITVRHYMSDVDLVEKMRNGDFKEYDPKLLNSNEGETINSNPEESPGIHEVYEQYCRYDLDDDGYAEPYRVFYHGGSKKVLAVFVNFVNKDIKFNKKGQVRKIKFKHNIVDYHCIDDPEGGYYSLGLNHILLHPNKVINTLQRQLVDAGTAANQQGGFYTESFKTNDKHLVFRKNEFQKVSTSPGGKIQDQIMTMPFKEPSQVLFAFLGMLIENTKELGFITDALTGDISGQNVPATTMLAIIEQGTRAFKPVIQKLFISLKQEFDLIFDLNFKHLDNVKYMRFHDKSFAVTREDFSREEYDISPVADPTMSSEAHKFARSQGMFQLLQLQLPYVNGVQIVMDYMDTMGINDTQKYINPPPQESPPDPKLMKVMSDQQSNAMKLQIQMLEQKRKEKETEMDEEKLNLLKLQVYNELDSADDERRKMAADTKRSFAEAGIKDRLADIAEAGVHNESRRLDILARQSRDKSSD